ncbi:MAG: hypothetical protein NT121_00205 [Chloroflexi bacterium]|nr:hypothetical protein [Chloroflexota bacterium]
MTAFFGRHYDEIAQEKIALVQAESAAAVDFFGPVNGAAQS